VVLSTFGAYEVAAREAVATFGRPGRTYRYREYTIMVWRENLLARLPLKFRSLPGLSHGESDV
jgi:hypothetical protein